MAQAGTLYTPREDLNETLEMVLGSLALAIFLVSLPAFCLAANSQGEPGRNSTGPNPLKNVYFGEEYMHTRNSFDAVNGRLICTVVL